MRLWLVVDADVGVYLGDWRPLLQHPTPVQLCDSTLLSPAPMTPTETQTFLTFQLHSATSLGHVVATKAVSYPQPLHLLSTIFLTTYSIQSARQTHNLTAAASDNAIICQPLTIW
ncbi:hypothetical protein KSP39_PZI016549 [Platanthera zijinensis]|uniref:Uncharacterized protein n=1 Tax=Platanthera zijinensis TaxID=2320716 RepID=A0AAP0B6Y2_9ASPA